MDDILMDVFEFVARPILGNSVSLTNRRLNALAQHKMHDSCAADYGGNSAKNGRLVGVLILSGKKQKNAKIRRRKYHQQAQANEPPIMASRAEEEERTFVFKVCKSSDGNRHYKPLPVPHMEPSRNIGAIQLVLDHNALDQPDIIAFLRLVASKMFNSASTGWALEFALALGKARAAQQYGHLTAFFASLAQQNDNNNSNKCIEIMAPKSVGYKFILKNALLPDPIQLLDSLFYGQDSAPISKIKVDLLTDLNVATLVQWLMSPLPLQQSAGQTRFLWIERFWRNSCAKLFLETIASSFSSSKVKRLRQKNSSEASKPIFIVRMPPLPSGIALMGKKKVMFNGFTREWLMLKKFPKLGQFLVFGSCSKSSIMENDNGKERSIDDFFTIDDLIPLAEGNNNNKLLCSKLTIGPLTCRNLFPAP